MSLRSCPVDDEGEGDLGSGSGTEGSRGDRRGFIANQKSIKQQGSEQRNKNGSLRSSQGEYAGKVQHEKGQPEFRRHDKVFTGPAWHIPLFTCNIWQKNGRCTSPLRSRKTCYFLVLRYRCSRYGLLFLLNARGWQSDKDINASFSWFRHRPRHGTDRAQHPPRVLWLQGYSWAPIKLPQYVWKQNTTCGF